MVIKAIFYLSHVCLSFPMTIGTFWVRSFSRMHSINYNGWFIQYYFRGLFRFNFLYLFFRFFFIFLSIVLLFSSVIVFPLINILTWVLRWFHFFIFNMKNNELLLSMNKSNYQSLMTPMQRKRIRSTFGATIKTNATIWFHSRSLDLTIPSPAIVMRRKT
jgi:hypothetical protein